MDLVNANLALGFINEPVATKGERITVISQSNTHDLGCGQDILDQPIKPA